jgi:hypothetical protein
MTTLILSRLKDASNPQSVWNSVGHLSKKDFNILYEANYPPPNYMLKFTHSIADEG